MRSNHSALCLAMLILCTVTYAGPLPPDEVPEPLQPWMNWVLLDHPQQECPLLYNVDRRRCAWPARLDISLNDRQGTFTQSWRIFADSWVMLLGDDTLWPQDIRVDGARWHTQ